MISASTFETAMQKLGSIGIFNVFTTSYGASTNQTVVEFYDSRFAGPLFTANGQFVSRYYVATFLAIKDEGLMLDTATPDWQLTPGQVLIVQQALRKAGF